MTKLKAFVPSLDAVDEALKGFYTESTELEGFILQVQAHTDDKVHFALEDTYGLKSALDKEKEANKSWKWLKDKEPEQVKKALSFYDDIEEGKPNAEVDALVAKKLDGQTAKYTTRIKELETERDTANAKAEKIEADLLGNRAQTAFLDAIQADSPDNKAKLIAKLAADRVKVIDGKVVVVDENGEPEISRKAGAGGAFKDVSELVSELRESEDLKPLFAGKAKSGGGGGQGGAGGSNGGQGDPKDNPFAKDSENVGAQMALIESEPEKAKELATAAGAPVYW